MSEELQSITPTPNPLQPAGYGGVSSDSEIKIPYHTHDGLNSPKLTTRDLPAAVATIATHGEIFIPAEAMNPTTTAGCAALAKVEAATNDVDYWVLDFDTTTAESCFFTLRMPDNWNASTVTFRFIWTNAAGLTTETVDWGIKGRAYADSDAIDQAYGTEVVTTDTWLAQGDIHLSAESSAVTLAGTPAAGQWAQFKITRKTSTDNMTGDARLIGIRLKYSIT